VRSRDARHDDKAGRQDGTGVTEEEREGDTT